MALGSAPDRPTMTEMLERRSTDDLDDHSGPTSQFMRSRNCDTLLTRRDVDQPWEPAKSPPQD